MTQNLNLPAYEPRISRNGNRLDIWDFHRNKWVCLTPEEEVRQHFLNYLIHYKNYPPGLLAVEYGLKVNHLSKRADIVLFSSFGHPLLLVECKAPSIKISQKTFDQTARYNLSLKVDYLIVTNGINHFCCQLDFVNQRYIFLEEIPDYQLILDSV
jgi:hypothetical protein